VILQHIGLIAVAAVNARVAVFVDEKRGPSRSQFLEVTLAASDGKEPNKSVSRPTADTIGFKTPKLPAICIYSNV
jgi:hypothetical protein